jgi:N-acetylneuraminic acid mutarotase
MKWKNCEKIEFVLIVFVVAMVLGGGSAKADFTWSQKTEMPITSFLPSANVVGGKIYVIGGWHTIGGEWNPQWEALTRVDEYDPTTDTWKRKADMPTGRGHTNACVVDGKIYVIGGDSGPGDSPIPTVEVYDPVTDTWTQKADMPTKRFWFSISAVDGIIYVIGGNNGRQAGWNHLGTVEAYDTTTDTWTTKARMATRRSFLATCVVDGLIYAIGGGAPGKTAVEVYDPDTDTWTTKAPMPTSRYEFGACVVNGKIFTIGGWWFSTSGPIYSTVEVYDPATDTWTKGVDIPVTTAGLSTCAIDGKIYNFGGTTVPHASEHWILTSAVYANEPIVDFNGDGFIDIDDLLIMIDNWGTDDSTCDIGPMPWGDGEVDMEDLTVFMKYWEQENMPQDQENEQ